MKKLLCVLMVGMMFGQAELTTATERTGHNRLKSLTNV